MKRIGIFVFYDKAGIADNYVYYLLDKVTKVLDDLIIVVNGIIDMDTEKRFQKYTNHVHVRPNEGFDAEAYREVILSSKYEWNTYDQVIIFNDTFYGPFVDMNLIFDEMQKQEVDFWGLSKWKEGKAGLFEQQVLPDHVQGYFVVFEKTILQDAAFMDFWNSMPKIETYLDAIQHFEVNLTQFFIKRNFTYGSWIDRNGENDYLEPGITIYNKFPYELMKHYDFPVIKRRALGIGNFRNARKAIEYIREFTEYDVQLITEHLSRIQQGEICNFFSYDRLMEFAENHNKLYIYGYGKYASILKEFFKAMLWEIEAFVVTNVDKVEAKDNDKIIGIDKLQLEESDGIVIALGRKNLLEVKPYLLDNYKDTQLLFPHWE